MNSFNINELQERYAVERDAREFSFCDTLDVKTSVILVVVIFLAGQSEHFLQSTQGLWASWLQYTSVAFLILAGVFAVAELWPRDYGTEGSPTKYDEWIEKLKTHYSEDENVDSAVLDQAVAGRALRARERAELNILTNKRKSALLFASFLCAVVSLTANLATLATRLF